MAFETTAECARVISVAALTTAATSALQARGNPRHHPLTTTEPSQAIGDLLSVLKGLCGEYRFVVPSCSRWGLVWANSTAVATALTVPHDTISRDCGGRHLAYSGMLCVLPYSFFHFLPSFFLLQHLSTSVPFLLFPPRQHLCLHAVRRQANSN